MSTEMVVGPRGFGSPTIVTDLSLPQGVAVLHVGPHVYQETRSSGPLREQRFVNAAAGCTGCGRRVATRAESRSRSINDWARLHECQWVQSTWLKYVRTERES